MDVLMEGIKHIVVLMLENRSFDNMLGKLYPKSDGFNGLTGDEVNLDAAGKPVKIWNQPGTDRDTMTLPCPDPGELWLDINTQIFGAANLPDPPPTASMSGFVRNYVDQAPPAPPPGSCRPDAIMHYFSPEQVPVISRLARQFAVCDQWHASAPNQTWPNRFFMHCATANGFVDNSPTHFPYCMPTIFTRFNHVGLSDAWKVYFHDMPQSLTLADLWAHVGNFRLFAEFRHDALNGTLPSYSFLEPRYFPDADLPNDQHPPHVVTLGEQLIADVYNCLRQGPKWTETLLIITYDEHGGCYDHVPPPPATPPSAGPVQPFRFDRYGVRVPAVLISPYIKQGTVLRAPEGGPPFDHTSIIATLRKCFSLGPPLSDRDGAAPDLSGVFTLDSPDNIGPEALTALPYVASPGELARARLEPLSDLQKSLTELAARLPALGAGDNLLQSIAAHIATLEGAVAGTLAPPAQGSAGDALHFVKLQLGKLFAAL